MNRLRWVAFALVFVVAAVGAGSAWAADVGKGKTLFERCAACHSLADGENGTGPNLAGIFGRKVAAVEEYRYSAAMKRSDIVWTERTLDAFIEDPQAFIPGTRMPFDGLKEKSEREDLLAYLEAATKSLDTARRPGAAGVRTTMSRAQTKRLRDPIQYCRQRRSICSIQSKRLTFTTIST